MERSDIVCKRYNFLRKMKELRCTGRPIIYLDETWVNVNHTKDKVWMCEGPDGDYVVPIRKRTPFIVQHAGSSSGFIPGALLCFQSKSTKDGNGMDGFRCSYFLIFPVTV